MKTAVHPSTDEIIVGMLTENTGRHILDSGDAYGRHWQRNAGKTLADYKAEPPAVANEWGVTLSVFHYLSERLSFSPTMQDAFDEHAKQNPDESWLSLCESFAESRDSSFTSWNTYNYDRDLLSQTLQGCNFYDSESGEIFTLLQIHGGADVRGGYTAPKAFMVMCDMGAHFPYDCTDALLHCPTDSDHSVSLHGSDTVSLMHGSLVDDSEYPRFVRDENHGHAECGQCGAVMEVEAPSPY